MKYDEELNDDEKNLIIIIIITRIIKIAEYFETIFTTFKSKYKFKNNSKQMKIFQGFKKNNS